METGIVGLHAPPLEDIRWIDEDGADRGPVHLDGKVRRVRGGSGMAKESHGVLPRVGMREAIAQVRPHPAVVGMPCQRRGVVQPPRAHRSTGKGQHHVDL